MIISAMMLARIQFAFVVSFHIIFPSFTIGLASWLAILEWRWLKTENNLYKDVYRMWVKIFAVCFGMGVVSGIVMSYQFGTNWSVFSTKVGNVIGPLLGYEVLTAFFLESSFLGIMLFGWERVSKKMHFVSTCVVAIGTLISAFWIISANSWMHTPQGFEIGVDGLLYPTDWLKIIFNPSFCYRFFHMVTASYLTTAFIVGGIGAYYLWKKIHTEHAKIMFAMAMIMAVFVAPLQLIIGDLHGKNTLKHQPIKVAAIEGNWDRGTNKPLHLFGIPNEETETTDYVLNIPGGASWVLTGKTSGEIPGLKDVTADNRPPVFVVFWLFRVMVAIGFAMIFTGIVAAVLYFRRSLFNNRIFQLWCMTMIPAGFIAVLAGWFVTEVGRQPYTVYGVIRTSESISPVIAEQIGITLMIFVIVYAFVFGSGVYYIIKLIRWGPVFGKEENYYDHSSMALVSKEIYGIEEEK
ncbi:MAG: cytochrome ubiquinol oxidase subunit I [Rickettsiaceae bacterium H1]|nr:cytochrome ubiquinol oxidase subunit I [Rickettsiaceae bacterium H1]